MFFFPELAILMYLRGLKRQNITMTKKITYIIASAAAMAVVAFFILRTGNEAIESDNSCTTDSLEMTVPQDTVKMYGFPIDDYIITYRVLRLQTWIQSWKGHED